MIFCFGGSPLLYFCFLAFALYFICTLHLPTISVMSDCSNYCINPSVCMPFPNEPLKLSPSVSFNCFFFFLFLSSECTVSITRFSVLCDVGGECVRMRAQVRETKTVEFSRRAFQWRHFRWNHFLFWCDGRCTPFLPRIPPSSLWQVAVFLSGSEAKPKRIQRDRHSAPCGLLRPSVSCRQAA